MTTSPQTIGNDLIDRLNDACTREKVLPLEIAKLKKEAKDLVKVNAVEGYTVLGAVACIENDKESMLKNHEKALRLAPTDGFVITNYISSLGRTWFLQKQFYFLQSLINQNLYLESSLVKSAYNRSILGDYQTACQFVLEYIQKFGDGDMNANLEQIIEADKFLRTFDVKQADVELYSDVMNNILSSAGIAVGFVDHWITPDNEMIRNIALDVGIDSLNELNEKLIEELVDYDFSENFLRRFSGSYVGIQ